MERVKRPYDLGIDRLPMERADLLGGVDHGARSDSFYHQFLLEHQARRKSERQSVGGDDARMDCAFAATAWQFPHHASCISGAVRIQPAQWRTRLQQKK